MTNEKAIEVLEYARNYDGMDYGAPSIALDMAISSLRQQDVTDKNVGKMTNADRIRAMSDKELMRLRYSGSPHCKSDDPKKCNRHDFADGMSPCELCYYEWLQQPAEGDGHA